MRWTLIALFVAGLTKAGFADEPIGTVPTNKRLISESWHTATLAGLRSGYVHLTVHEVTRGEQKILRAERTLTLTVQRFGQAAQIGATTGTDETPDGKVLGVFMTQGLGKQVDLVLRGVVTGNQLHVTAEGKMKFDRMIPWDPEVVGAHGEMQLVAKKKPAPGTSFDYVIFEPIVNSLVKVRATAEAIEEVNIAGQKPRLLRITSKPSELEGVTLPGSTFWFDLNYRLIKSETDMPGLGKLVLEMSTREEALKPCLGPDLGMRQSIRLARRLSNPYGATEVIYRVRLNDKNALTVLANDERQSVRGIDEHTVEVTVHPVRQPPATAGDQQPPGQEFLTSNNFLNSDDERVKQHAAAAVGAETDPWKKAQLIEHWVNTHMKVLNFSEAMAPAAEVARTLEGDCTEYSMLTAAMARAVGIPSKTAIGLVYVDGRDRSPTMLAMHMWTEVWVRGKWVALDATLGRGSVSATHIKVTDHSWYQEATMKPLLPLMRFTAAQPTVEIISERGETPAATKPTSTYAPLQ
ncbi:MAG: transglutaminase family protein [Gemmataceae bacterium]